MTLLELDNWPLLKEHIQKSRQQHDVNSSFQFACRDMRQVRLQLIHRPHEPLADALDWMKPKKAP